MCAFRICLLFVTTAVCRFGFSFTKDVNFSSPYLSLVTKNESVAWLKNLTQSTTSSNKYCRICCINAVCGSHTMCRYPEGAGEGCNGYVQVKLNDGERKRLVDTHNTIRNLVASGREGRGKVGSQPSASNMRVMEWNEELAVIAERWAAQCHFEHDECRDLVYEMFRVFTVGQNIARGPYSNNNDLNFLKSWFDEVIHFDNSKVKSFNRSVDAKDSADSYTQLVWADTYLVGCAGAKFQAYFKNSSVTYVKHLICNYGPAGNIPNQPVNKTGLPCSACQEGTGCLTEYPALCGKTGRYDIQKLDFELNTNSAKNCINGLYVCLIFTVTQFLT